MGYYRRQYISALFTGPSRRQKNQIMEQFFRMWLYVEVVEVAQLY